MAKVSLSQKVSEAEKQVNVTLIIMISIGDSELSNLGFAPLHDLALHYLRYTSFPPARPAAQKKCDTEHGF